MLHLFPNLSNIIQSALQSGFSRRTGHLYLSLLTCWCKKIPLDSTEAWTGQLWSRAEEREAWTEVCSILMSLSDLDWASGEMRATQKDGGKRRGRMERLDRWMRWMIDGGDWRGAGIEREEEMMDSRREGDEIEQEACVCVCVSVCVCVYLLVQCVWGAWSLVGAGRAGAWVCAWDMLCECALPGGLDEPEEPCEGE